MAIICLSDFLSLLNESRLQNADLLYHLSFALSCRHKRPAVHPAYGDEDEQVWAKRERERQRGAGLTPLRSLSLPSFFLSNLPPPLCSFSPSGIGGIAPLAAGHFQGAVPLPPCPP